MSKDLNDLEKAINTIRLFLDWLKDPDSQLLPDGVAEAYDIILQYSIKNITLEDKNKI